MTPTARTLILMRHAKSDWPGGVLDHERPLADRGRREAALAGRAILADCPPVGAVLCSDALRTRQTLQHSGLTADPVRIEGRLYEASVPDVLAVIAGVDDAVDCLLVIGHAPGIPGAAQRLTDPSDADPRAFELLQAGFPTSAFAVLGTDRGWAELDDADCILQDLVIPR